MVRGMIVPSIKTMLDVIAGKLLECWSNFITTYFSVLLQSFSSPSFLCIVPAMEKVHACMQEVTMSVKDHGEFMSTSEQLIPLSFLNHAHLLLLLYCQPWPVYVLQGRKLWCWRWLMVSSSTDSNFSFMLGTQFQLLFDSLARVVLHAALQEAMSAMILGKYNWLEKGKNNYYFSYSSDRFTLCSLSFNSHGNNACYSLSGAVGNDSWQVHTFFFEV